MMPPRGTYPQYNPPVCQTCNRPLGSDLEKILNAQINQLLEQVNALRQQVDQEKATARNLQANHDADEKRIQEMQAQINETNANASERWKMVAFALGYQLPEPQAGNEYMDRMAPQRYTAEYAIKCATESRIKLQMAEQAAAMYKGQLLTERQILDDHVKRLTSAAVENNLKAIEAPKDGDDGDL